MIQYGGDVSNFTSPLTVDQQAYVNVNWQRVCIGLQDAGRARDFQRQFAGIEREYYIERPNRDLSIPEPGSVVWVDVEPGCITTEADMDLAIANVEARGLIPVIYGNEASIKPVIGESLKYAKYGLVYANYGTPDFSRFRPFNGWTKIRCLQYSSDGVAGINADLDMWNLEDEQMATERYDGELNNARALKAVMHNLMLTTPVHFDPADPHTAIMTDLQGVEKGRLTLEVLPDYDSPN